MNYNGKFEFCCFFNYIISCCKFSCNIFFKKLWNNYSYITCKNTSSLVTACLYTILYSGVALSPKELSSSTVNNWSSYSLISSQDLPSPFTAFLSVGLIIGLGFFGHILPGPYVNNIMIKLIKLYSIS